jgi:hypothetical protein
MCIYSFASGECSNFKFYQNIEVSIVKFSMDQAYSLALWSHQAYQYMLSKLWEKNREMTQLLSLQYYKPSIFGQMNNFSYIRVYLFTVQEIIYNHVNSIND